MIRSICLLCFLTFPLLASSKSSATQEFLISESKEFISDDFSASAEALGLSISQMKYATDQFLLMVSEVKSPQMNEFREVHELMNPELYSQQEIMVAYNNQQTQMANFLGLPVDKLNPFFNEMTQHIIDDDEFQRHFRTNTTNDKYERIVIKCVGACGQITSFESLLLVYAAATDNDIPQFQNFIADFYNSDSSHSSRGLYRYNNFSSAWLERQVSKPCERCAFE
ncbi:hypothetical protein Q4561_05980 [Alteromonas sp. 1_MG-2023]|uniref:hypothetical protein n=1 Tax=Alteromonas sp. 1_MG-2023 TaxID=3062669 RepID=UPI0026E4402C|nr:hypothetical protein [Alteromonas sp. 1_MG-2023]MDO6566599.1 hypothetical protein [Alteromonas sp. 1_MG-2023]